MFRLIRLIVFVLLAFVAGLLFERARQSDTCTELGGTWTTTGPCVISGEQHG